MCNTYLENTFSMEQNKKTVRLTRDELRNMVLECIAEGVERGTLDEGIFGGLAGLASKIGQKASNTAAAKGIKKAGQKMADTASKVGHNVAGAAKSAGEFAKKQASDLKMGYQAGSTKEEYEKVWATMKKWASKGYFGKGRQTASRLSGLRNSMQNSFKEQFGEDLILQ